MADDTPADVGRSRFWRKTLKSIHMKKDNQTYKKAAELLGRMTLREKIGQMVQLNSKVGSQSEAEDLAREGLLGSRILAGNAFAGNSEQAIDSLRVQNAVQRVAVEESRLGIPILFGRDVIHGHRTIFPNPLGLAAGFDRDLVRQMARTSAQEAVAHAVHWTFSPMLDVARDARWGRITESFGEDPFLAGELGAAMIAGYQGETEADWAKPDHILACPKHFLGYGAVIGGRDYHECPISEHDLLNVHALPFRRAGEAGAFSMMSGFSQVNGDLPASSPALLRDLLREKLGFTGFVVSDYDAIAELILHRRCATRRESAQLAVKAGVNMDMCARVYLEELEALVNGGELPEADLDELVLPLLYAKFAVGLFENPYTDEALADNVLRQPPFVKQARQAVADCCVLLKNRDNLLPLNLDGKRLGVVGPIIDDQRLHLSSWHSDGRAEETLSLKQAFRDRLEPGTVAFSRAVEHAARVAMSTDVLVVTLGEDAGRTGENSSIVEARLPVGQEDYIEALTRFGKPIVSVICAGRPVELGRVERCSDAILYAWHGGNEAAHGIIDVLLGEREPGGRLPVGIHHHTGQLPLTYATKSIGRTGLAGVYQDAPNDPLYPFGFGLGYTTFAFETLELAKPEIRPEESQEVTVTVRNTGTRRGATVVQLYLRDESSERTRPVRELKGFQKISLEPGESREISFNLGSSELGYFGPDRQWIVEPGEFTIFVGKDSNASMQAKFQVGSV